MNKFILSQSYFKISKKKTGALGKMPSRLRPKRSTSLLA
jgi:hypothetical protein